MVTAEEKKTRLLYIEVLRILACFFVIYNHLPAFHLYLSPENMPGLKRISYMILSVITKFSVNIFFMISGVVLLNRTESMQQIFRRRIRKTIVVIVLVHFAVYGSYGLGQRLNGEDFRFSLGTFLQEFVYDDVPESYPYWFLSTYLCFLLVLPFMRRMACGMKDAEFGILTAGMIIKDSLVPLINVILYKLDMDPIHLGYPLPLLDVLVFYPLAGYYLNSRIDVSKLKTGHMICASAMELLGIGLTCVLIYYDKSANQEFSQEYISSFSWYHTFYIFVMVKYLVAFKFRQSFAGRPGRIITVMGSLTFGIYLLDPLLKCLIYRQFTDILWADTLPPLVGSTAWCLFSMVTGGLLTWLLKRIPKVSRFL